MGESLARSEGLGRQFLLSVSHELRTPLTSIRGYADALADGATDDVAGAVDDHRQRGEDDSNASSGICSTSPGWTLGNSRSTRSASTVATSWRRWLSDSGRKRSRARSSCRHIVPDSASQPGGGLWVDADPDRLGQVVANLVENAFKFARLEGGRRDRDVGPQTSIWVVDDGPGIAAEDLPHVFERHFSSDRVPTRKLGTGLGSRDRRRADRGHGLAVHRRVPGRRRPRHADDGLVEPIAPARRARNPVRPKRRADR